jgi:hypothetical protein
MLLRKEAEVSRRAAAAFSSVDDDEILHPRWQSNGMKSNNIHLDESERS